MSQLLGFRCDQCCKTLEKSTSIDKANRLVSLKLPVADNNFRDEMDFCNLECMLNYISKSVPEVPGSSQIKAMQGAKAAIEHVLNRIRDDERVANLLGCGTQSYALLTEAAALLWAEPVDKVREHFIPGSASIHRKRT